MKVNYAAPVHLVWRSIMLLPYILCRGQSTQCTSCEEVDHASPEFMVQRSIRLLYFSVAVDQTSVF